MSAVTADAPPFAMTLDLLAIMADLPTVSKDSAAFFACLVN